MAKIDESKYKFLFFHEQDSLLRVYWLSSTYHMSEKEFKEELNSYVAYVKELNPKFVLVNSSQFEYTIHRDMQSWIRENISPEDTAIYQKIAYVKPDDFHAERSLTQFHDTQGRDRHNIRYFMHEGDAKKWLLE